ncbi:hypothetical protein V8F06_010362 [Rhypophila decipiens]
MAGSTTFIDCTDLDAFRVFGDYADLLRNRTSFNETLLRGCQKPICRALWGFGVPDLSGIGVAIGYVLSIAISTALCLLVAFGLPPSASPAPESPAPETKTRPASRSILISGLSSYFDSAVYFSLAIQIATITILAPKDLETAPSSIGYYEIRIAGLVSTLSLLPLLTPVVVLLLYDHDHDHHRIVSSPAPQNAEKTNMNDNPNNEQQIPHQNTTLFKKENRHPYRLSILGVTVLASVYTFLSQSIRYWSPSTLGDHKGDGGKTEISTEESGVLWNICFGDLEGPSFTAVEHITLGAFHMIASIVVVLFTSALLVPVLVRRVVELHEHDEDEEASGEETKTTGFGRILAFTERSVKRMSELVEDNVWARVFLVVVAFCLTVPLLWGFFRLRDIQTSLALAVGGSYEGNDWGFGQIMAIAVFSPVGAEMLFVWAQRRLEGHDTNPGQQEQNGNTEPKEPDGGNADTQTGESTLEIQGRDRMKTWPW